MIEAKLIFYLKENDRKWKRAWWKGKGRYILAKNRYRWQKAGYVYKDKETRFSKWLGFKEIYWHAANCSTRMVDLAKRDQYGLNGYWTNTKIEDVIMEQLRCRRAVWVDIPETDPYNYKPKAIPYKAVPWWLPFPCFFKQKLMPI